MASPGFDGRGNLSAYLVIWQAGDLVSGAKGELKAAGEPDEFLAGVLLLVAAMMWCVLFDYQYACAQY